MSNPYFQFKQFTVFHDKCAMKVGTDGALLGAWAPVDCATRVLDIGTGSGLIALMMAQRLPAARITGIDIDEGAVRQAAENVAASPWKERIRICRQDICRYREGEPFDAIVSNPPYFVERVSCADAARNAARHTDSLDFDSLLAAVADLLADTGTFSVILPSTASAGFIATALRHRLYLSRQTWVHTKPGKPAKRVLMTFVRRPADTCTEHLFIEWQTGAFSPEFVALLRDFYLKF